MLNEQNTLIHSVLVCVTLSAVHEFVFNATAISVKISFSVTCSANAGNIVISLTI